MECGVYKYVYQGEIIYIGKTQDCFKNRVNCHSKEKKFEPYLEDCEIYVCNCANPTEAKIIEKCLINEYKPVLNVVDNYEGNSNLITINALKWRPYGEEDSNWIDKFFSEMFSRSAYVLEDDLVSELDALMLETLETPVLGSIEEKWISKRIGSLNRLKEHIISDFIPNIGLVTTSGKTMRFLELDFALCDYYQNCEKIADFMTEALLRERVKDKSIESMEELRNYTKSILKA